MKKGFNIRIIIVSIALLLNSCSNFLEIDTSSTIIDAKQYYNTEADMELAITGVYDILGKNLLYAYGLVVRFATEADEGFYANNMIANGCQFYNMNSSDNDVAGLWTHLYDGIARANILLDNIDKPSMSEEKRTIVRGEAMFLRAYYHFLLIQNFGDVPLITEAFRDFEDLKRDVVRSKTEKIYEFISKEMEEAETLVPSIREIGHSGRISKSAVRSILARVYLHWAGYPLKNEEKYKDVVTWTEKVINDTEIQHELNPSYRQVFVNMAQDKYDIKESIWEVEFSSNATGNNEKGQIGSWIGISTNNTTIGTAYGFIAALPRLFDSYENGDLRRDRAIANFYYTGAEGAVTFYPAATKYGKRVAKWRRAEETALPKAPQNTPINFPIIRFPDVLLMHAEAKNELSSSVNAPQEAIDDVNILRLRAWASGVKKITVTSGGTDYTSPPIVRITGGGGDGARAEAVLDTLKKVISIRLFKDIDLGYTMGEGYTSEPEVIISGGGGSGATATAEIYKKEDGLISTMSKEDFREFIRDERSRELCFEGLRKYDLIRWNIFIEKLKDIKLAIENNAPNNYKYAVLSYANVQEKHRLLPIPISELNLNKNLIQNPGY